MIQRKCHVLPTKEHRLNDLSKELIMMKVKTKELQGMEERLDRHLDESQGSMLTTFTIPRNEIQQEKIHRKQKDRVYHLDRSTSRNCRQG